MFVVRVADNFHYMDQDEVYTHGEFSTWEDAVLAAKSIVDSCLAEYFKVGMTADDLYSQYTSFGDDPFIVPVPAGEHFSGWEYAEQRCTVLCRPSGAIVNQATPVDQAAARSARPPLSLAISKQEVFEREEQCIELLRLEAQRGNIPMPENVVPKKRWWRQKSKRRVPYDRPDEKSIAELAGMYGQRCRIEIMVDWIGVLYGAAARLHYKHLAESLQEQRTVANRRWLERCPDGPLPTRRPISSDWLLSVEKELPLYDAAVRE